MRTRLSVGNCSGWNRGSCIMLHALTHTSIRLKNDTLAQLHLTCGAGGFLLRLTAGTGVCHGCGHRAPRAGGTRQARTRSAL